MPCSYAKSKLQGIFHYLMCRIEATKHNSGSVKLFVQPLGKSGYLRANFFETHEWN
jgi:hypothetical protein